MSENQTFNVRFTWGGHQRRLKMIRCIGNDLCDTELAARSAASACAIGSAALL
jgi:hypothetical protein